MLRSGPVKSTAFRVGAIVATAGMLAVGHHAWLPNGLWHDRARTRVIVEVASIRTIALSDALAKRPSAVFVDARDGDAAAGKAPVPNSIRLPPSIAAQPAELARAMTDVDPGRPVVVYCSPGCDLDRVVAAALIRAGWIDVRVLRDKS